MQNCIDGSFMEKLTPTLYLAYSINAVCKTSLKYFLSTFHPFSLATILVRPLARYFVNYNG